MKTSKTAKRKRALPAIGFNEDTGFVVAVLPDGRECRTIAELMSQVDDHRIALGLSKSRVARNAGILEGSVTRALNGPRGGERKKLVNDHTMPGRVRFDTLLTLIHSLGLDIELVERKDPGRLLSGSDRPKTCQIWGLAVPGKRRSRRS